MLSELRVGSPASLKLDRPALIQNYLGSNPRVDSDSESIVSADCDEKRSYTPEPRQLESLHKRDSFSQSVLQRETANVSVQSVYGGAPSSGVNMVYKSTNMELSRYINKNTVNKEPATFQQLIENKGSRCQCSKQVVSPG